MGGVSLQGGACLGGACSREVPVTPRFLSNVGGDCWEVLVTPRIIEKKVN